MSSGRTRARCWLRWRRPADLLLAGMTEQCVAANVAEYQDIPFVALIFFPARIQNSGLLQSQIAKPAEARYAGHWDYPPLTRELLSDLRAGCSSIEIPLPEIGREHLVDVHVDAAKKRTRVRRAVDHLLVQHRGGLALSM